MNTIPVCENAAPLPSDAPPGLCPSCKMAAALEATLKDL